MSHSWVCITLSQGIHTVKISKIVAPVSHLSTLAIWCNHPYLYLPVGTQWVKWFISHQPSSFPWTFLIPNLGWVNLGSEVHFFFFKSTSMREMNLWPLHWQADVLATALHGSQCMQTCMSVINTQEYELRSTASCSLKWLRYSEDLLLQWQLRVKASSPSITPLHIAH